jgi:outer membrane lipoprotein-sorting protein
VNMSGARRVAQSLCVLQLAGCAGAAGASELRPNRFALPAPNTARQQPLATSTPLVAAQVNEGPAVPVAGGARADDGLRVEQILANVDGRYQTMRDFGVEFSVEVANATRSLTSATAGAVWFASPGMMRWDHFSRPGFRVVCDGTTVRVTSRTLAAPQLIPIAQSELAAAFAFVTGRGTLAGDFRATMRRTLAGPPRVLFVIDLLPRQQHPALASMSIAVEATSFLVREVLVVDATGGSQRFVFHLSTMRENRGVDRAFFQ